MACQCPKCGTTYTCGKPPEYCENPICNKKLNEMEKEQ